MIGSVFFVLIFGMIDFGSTVFDVNATTAVTRDASRSAAAWVGSSTSPTTCVGLTPTSFSSGGGVDPNEGLRIICNAKRRLAMVSPERARVAFRFEDADGIASDGVVVSPTDNKYIVVCVQVRARSLSGLFKPLVNNKVLFSRARARLDYSPHQPGGFHLPTGGEAMFQPARPC